MSVSYAEFLARKQVHAVPVGVDIDPSDVHPSLHPWQARIVTWAVRTGRCALWADTGLGKTRMRLEWARLPGGTSLVVAPLVVCAQTVREAAQIDITARYVRDGGAVNGPGIWVTNYEMVERFDPAVFDAVVLDESSILKDFTSKTRAKLIDHFAGVPRRLACSATPAPNDVAELTNHAEFLGVMSRTEMLAAYFIHDDNGWRLKGHARQPMFRWMSSWAVALRRPSDIGFPDDGYDLPGLEIHPELIPVAIEQEGQLFPTSLGGVGGRSNVRRQTLLPRCDRVIELVNAIHEVQEGQNTWDGSPSTRPLAELSTKRIPPNERSERLKAETRSRTANTCGSTTGTTRNGSCNTVATPPSGATPDEGSATPPIRSTGHERSIKPSSETSGPSGTIAYARTSDSRQTTTTCSSNSRATAVPFAERRSETQPDATWQSITATERAECEGSSAAPATSDLASFETTPSSLPPPSGTSQALEPWVIWCGLNDEQELLERAFGDRCISLTGSQSPEEKVQRLYRWLDGERPILLTKPSIAGFGINMQHCARMAFVGMNDSYEQYYQAIRRCYRYGQTRPVHVYLVLSELEGQIAANVARKERDANRFTDGLVAAMRQEWSDAA